MIFWEVVKIFQNRCEEPLFLSTAQSKSKEFKVFLSQFRGLKSERKLPFLSSCKPSKAQVDAITIMAFTCTKVPPPILQGAVLAFFRFLFTDGKYLPLLFPQDRDAFSKITQTKFGVLTTFKNRFNDIWG